MNPDIVSRISDTLTEAANDNCICCQHQTLRWLHELGWQWLEVNGKTAIIRFGFNISDIRIEINNRPGVLSSCRGSEVEAPAVDVASSPSGAWASG